MAKSRSHSHLWSLVEVNQANISLVVLDCQYTTTAGIPTYELILRDLELHTRYAHSEISPQVDQGGGQNVAGGPKPDRIPRPTIGEGVTEANQKHFSDKWTRYKRSTLSNTTAQHISDQLWACCDSELETAVYNTGINSDSDEATLLAAMES